MAKPGGVINKSPFEMGVANLKRKKFMEKKLNRGKLIRKYIGAGLKEVVSAKVNGDIGWLQDKIGLGAKLPLSPWESLRVLGYHQSVVDAATSYSKNTLFPRASSASVTSPSAS